MEHVKACESCRHELGDLEWIETAVKEALQIKTSAADGAARVLARIGEPLTTIEARTSAIRRGWRRSAAAAAVLAAFVAGISAGLMFGKSVREARHGNTDAAQVTLGVAQVDGVVLRREKGASNWSELQRDAPLHRGDEIMTAGKSALVLQGPDGATVRLEGGTSLALTSWDGEAELELTYGRMRATLSGPHPPFTVSTPQGRIRALGTDFTVTVE